MVYILLFHWHTRTLGFDHILLMHVLSALYSEQLTAWSVGPHIGSPRDSLVMTRVCDNTSQARAERMCHFIVYDINRGGGGGSLCGSLDGYDFTT